MTTQLISKNCDGGHYTCSAPKDCCKQGCCYLSSNSAVHRPIVPAVSMFNPLFLGHWYAPFIIQMYFWLAVTATVAGILCACSLWRRHSQGGFCCRNTGREDRASEPDSNGSCYAPPQYSRCNSFHQAPPPYTEVTSKPDLYPLVISYNGDNLSKSHTASTGYLMVQYFRNFIVRPVGTISATSTIDSLSSSFICNAANEANTIIPPPYSCTGSLEEVTPGEDTPQNSELRPIPPSTSLLSVENNYPCSPSAQSHLSCFSNSTSSQNTPAHMIVNTRTSSVVSIRDNPCFGQNTTNIVHTTLNAPVVASVPKEVIKTNCDFLPPIKVNKKVNLHKLPKECSQDSESEEHNFSDLLNLSVCIPNSVVNLEAPIQTQVLTQELQYSVTNSMTGSDISSLANLGTPDSPPRATSPTVEMKELLDKIQQLPQHKSPTSQMQQPQVEFRINKNHFHKSKSKTMYMQLHAGPSSNSIKNKSSPTSKIFTKSWLSRSAPNTPCGTFVPTFPIQKTNNFCSQRNSKCKLGDNSPLLKDHGESDEDNNKDGNS